LRAKRGATEGATIIGKDINGITGLGAPRKMGNRTSKQPGVTPQNRTFPARLQNQFGHFVSPKVRSPVRQTTNGAFEPFYAVLTQRLTITGVTLGGVDSLEHGATLAHKQPLGGLGNTAALQRGTTGTIDGHNDNS